MNFVKRMQHFLLQFTCFLKRKWIWQKINNVFSNSVFRLNNEILITLHLYIYFLKTQYTNILFNQVPWNSRLEKVKLHCVKVIGPDYFKQFHVHIRVKSTDVALPHSSPSWRLWLFYRSRNGSTVSRQKPASTFFFFLILLCTCNKYVVFRDYMHILNLSAV